MTLVENTQIFKGAISCGNCQKMPPLPGAISCGSGKHQKGRIVNFLTLAREQQNWKYEHMS